MQPMLIPVEEGPQRLDNFLAKALKGVPRSWIYRMIRKGAVRVDGKRTSPDLRVVAGQSVAVPPVRLGSAVYSHPVRWPTACPDVAIAYEDEALLILVKPSGLAVHGGSGVRWGLIEWLRSRSAEAQRWALVHRLDRDTSGLVVVAKKRSALVALQQAWQQGKVVKRYLALSLGVMNKPEMRIEAALEKYRTQQGERRVRISSSGKEAATLVRRIALWEHLPGFSLLHIELETGRMHQIRAHLAHARLPILGDAKYGDFALNRVLARRFSRYRLALHAYELNFWHPLSGERLWVRAPLPADLEAMLHELGEPSWEDRTLWAQVQRAKK